MYKRQLRHRHLAQDARNLGALVELRDQAEQLLLGGFRGKRILPVSYTHLDVYKRQILLSFLLSKTITTPIERITEGARSIAKGNFDQELGVQSSDEIGELTRSFNYMAGQLKNTVGEVQGERDKLNTLFLHMTDGVAAFTTAGRLIHMNPATESLLGVRVEDGLTFDEMFADLDMPNSDETAMRSFLTSEITRFGRVLSVTLAPYGALDGEGGVIAVIHDITEQRRLDDARREFVANV